MTSDGVVCILITRRQFVASLETRAQAKLGGESINITRVYICKCKFVASRVAKSLRDQSIYTSSI